MTEKNFGDSITAEEVYVCDDCARKHKHSIINELEKFRKSKEYNDRLELKKKILWASESLGNYFDNATGTIIESVSDYDNCNVFELQSDLLNIELDCVNSNLAEGEFGFPTKNNPELQNLRKDLIEVYGACYYYALQSNALKKLQADFLQTLAENKDIKIRKISKFDLNKYKVMSFFDFMVYKSLMDNRGKEFLIKTFKDKEAFQEFIKQRQNDRQ